MEGSAYIVITADVQQGGDEGLMAVRGGGGG